MAVGWHVNFKLGGREVLAPSRSWRLVFVNRMAHFAPRVELLTFCLAGDHGHVVVLGPRPGAFVHALECSLRWHLDLAKPFRRAWFEPVETHRHLSSAFHYCLGQVARHGLAADPVREASNLPDLIGARSLFWETRARVREHLPRTTRQSLCRHYGLDHVGEGSDTSLLRQAAEAANGGPLRVHGTQGVRGAALRVALDMGLSVRAAARVLDMHPAGVPRLVGAASPEAERAVRQQLYLISKLAPELPKLCDSPRARPNGRREARGL